MTSILKTDEIQSQNGGAVVKMQTLKHPSATGNNLELASDGSATATLSSTSVVPASVGSSMVLVKSSQGFSVTNSDTLASAYIENCFNSTYRDYVIYITGTVGSTENNLNFRFGNSSGRISDAHYTYVHKGWDSTGTSRQIQGYTSSFASILNGARGTTGTDTNINRVVITMKIHNPQSSGGIVWTGTNSSPRFGTSFISSYFGGQFQGDNNSATNMQFYWSTSQTGTLNFQSYGIKTS